MKLSIITINYNNREGLIRTLESVANQDCKDFEHILVDGASTDGSAEVIREYAEGKENVIWVSEPDTGIYNAMNKGTRMAHGEYCLYLNSGDELCDGKVVKQFCLYSGSSDIVHGFMAGKNGVYYRGGDEAGNISLIHFLHESIPHQSSFIKKKLLDDIPYDENYKIVSDAKFFIQALIFRNCSFEVVNINVSIFEGSGISEGEYRYEEHQNMLHELFPEKIIKDYNMMYGVNEYFSLFHKLGKTRGFKRYMLFVVGVMVDVYMYLRGRGDN